MKLCALISTATDTSVSPFAHDSIPSLCVHQTPSAVSCMCCCCCYWWFFLGPIEMYVDCFRDESDFDAATVVCILIWRYMFILPPVLNNPLLRLLWLHAILIKCKTIYAHPSNGLFIRTRRTTTATRILEQMNLIWCSSGRWLARFIINNNISFCGKNFC